MSHDCLLSGVMAFLTFTVIPEYIIAGQIRDLRSALNEGYQK